ncbi:transposable element Tcb1 transposase [Trichonephila clavipes]|uniref:Transposable element Tcb1 transposase n=1 Tax=Trichonephila clavipes TaxID=2585209 RepID=A0A8X6SJH4_TRICX|nr:transposable element Tcb1 transposase [Trichonephila clavipes]
MEHVILNHGEVTWTTLELAPLLLTTTSQHQREDVAALDTFNAHRCPTRRVFSGTGLELVTRQATIRYLYLSTTAAMAVTDSSVTSRTVARPIVSVTQHSMSSCSIQHRLQLNGMSARRPVMHYDARIRVWRHLGERMLNSCVMHRHTGPAPCIMVWGGIGHHSRTPLVRIAGTLNSQRYISKVLEPVVCVFFLTFRAWPQPTFNRIIRDYT